MCSVDSSATLPPGMRAQLDSSSYMGVPTFGRRPHLTEPEQLDVWLPDVAVIGAPWDDGTTNVVALDVTEVSPPNDHADVTVNNAHRLIWETLAGLAHRKRSCH